MNFIQLPFIRILLAMGLMYSQETVEPIWAQESFDASYRMWQEALSSYTHQGHVDYKGLKERPGVLTVALAEVEGITQEEYSQFSVNQKIAFWINAYNVAVVKVIVDHYPIQRGFGLAALRYPANSIQQIPNVWNKPVLNVLKEQRSLNDIENKILRPEFKDPRIHFVVVCASIGCPVIRSEAYTAEKLDQQLSEQIRSFLSDPSKARYDKTKDTLYLSPIFKWFNADFQQVGGVVTFIKKYAPASLFDGISGRTQIQWLGYSWDLNEGYSK